MMGWLFRVFSRRRVKVNNKYLVRMLVVTSVEMIFQTLYKTNISTPVGNKLWNIVYNIK